MKNRKEILTEIINTELETWFNELFSTDFCTWLDEDEKEEGSTLQEVKRMLKADLPDRIIDRLPEVFKR
jgi:hypothetical protein